MEISGLTPKGGSGNSGGGGVKQGQAREPVGPEFPKRSTTSLRERSAPRMEMRVSEPKAMAGLKIGETDAPTSTAGQSESTAIATVTPFVVISSGAKVT